MLVVPVLFEIRPLIDALVGALLDLKLRGHTPVIARLEIADLQLAIEDDRERRGLHAANGGDVATPRAEHALGDRAGPVDPDEPVTFAPGARGIGQTGHLLAVAQGLKRFLDSAGGHGLHPGALDRQLRLRELVEILKNQLAFAPGVAGVDDSVDVFAVEQLFELIKAILRIGNRFQPEFFRDDRKRLKAPKTVFLFVDVLGHFEFDDMADRRGNDVFVVLEVVAFLGHFAERAGQIRATLGFSAIMRVLAMKGCQLDLVGVVCKSQQQRTGARYDSFTKYFPGSCLTRRFSSSRRRADETVALGRFARRGDPVDRRFRRIDRIVNKSLLIG